MSPELLTTTLDAPIEIRAESDGRTLDIRLVPWDHVAQTEQGRECFTRGAFTECDPELVTIESQRHGGELVGRGTEIEERDDAAYLSARVSDTPGGNALLTLVRDRVLTRASIAFAEIGGGTRRRADGVIERTRVDLRRVAVLERGAYPGAQVLAIRREPDMPDAELITTPPEPVVDLSPVLDRLERMESQIGTLATVGTAPRIEYRASTLGTLLTSAWADPELRTALAVGLIAERALVDQITTDNPGLVPPATIRQAALIVNRGRPTIDAVGTGPLPGSGMSVNWPTLTTPLTGLIAKQATEKAPIVSAKVSFGSANAAIQTFAGGSDISYQLIRRSDPPYLEQYARVMLAAWAGVTDQQFIADLTAGATGGTVVISDTSDAAAIVGALVDASLKVQTETGEPASVVSVASDLFAIIAKVWAPTSVNPQATGGTAMASTLSVNVSGLAITHDPYLAAGTGIVTNRTAAAWLEDGPNQITVDDAERIGQNVAYWSMGVSAIYAPAGIVEIAATAPLP